MHLADPFRQASALFNVSRFSQLPKKADVIANSQVTTQKVRDQVDVLTRFLVRWALLENIEDHIG